MTFLAAQILRAYCPNIYTVPEVKDFQLGPSSEVENICPTQTGGFLTDCYLTSVHVIEPNLRFELANI